MRVEPVDYGHPDDREQPDGMPGSGLAARGLENLPGDDEGLDHLSSFRLVRNAILVLMTELTNFLPLYESIAMYGYDYSQSTAK